MNWLIIIALMLFSFVGCEECMFGGTGDKNYSDISWPEYCPEITGIMSYTVAIKIIEDRFDDYICYSDACVDSKWKKLEICLDLLDQGKIVCK